MARRHNKARLRHARPPRPGYPAFTPEVISLLEQRNLARASGDFERADELRAALVSRGFVVEDDEGGTRLRPKRRSSPQLHL